MKIAILTSGILPVPAVQGGAVENLVDFYLAYNDCHQLHDITVYSVKNDAVDKHPALRSKVNHYYYVEVQSFLAKLKKRFHHLLRNEEYYHYTIEFFFEQALKHIQEQEYDMVIIENRPGYALKLSAHINAMIVHHLHNDFLNKHVNGAKEIYDTATRIITVSNYIGNCVKSIDQQGQKCVTVYNGIDLNSFSQAQAQELNRSALGLKPNDFVMIFSGRIVQQKGIRELILAMNMLKEYEDIKLLVIGSSFYGNDNADNDYVKQLKENAQGLEDRIIFTGFVPYSQMPNYLAISDVAIIPSLWDDPLPTSVLEAMAMGMPIITTRRGGIPEEVTPDNAILLPTDHNFVSKLLAAILDLYSHKEKRHLMGQMSLTLSHRFDKEIFAENFFRALDVKQ